MQQLHFKIDSQNHNISSSIIVFKFKNENRKSEKLLKNSEHRTQNSNNEKTKADEAQISTKI